MKLTIKNKTENNFDDLISLANNFFSFAKNKLELSKPVHLHIKSDISNHQNPLGRTAYYSPDNNLIILFSDGRHIKDMLRSFAHELIHHKQNCDGHFKEDHETFDGYAQEDPHLRKLEKEAYLSGNMTFRDWEDEYKRTNNLLREWVNKVKQKSKMVL